MKGRFKWAVRLAGLAVLAVSFSSCIPMLAGGAFLYAAGDDKYSQQRLAPADQPDFGTEPDWGNPDPAPSPNR